jgi:hypothetical protein
MPWHKGQSGNPGGTSKGCRRKLTDAFLRALARDWEAHGEAVIQRVREDNPVAYFKGLVSLVPKDHTIDAAVEQTVKVQGLQATAQFLEDIRDRASPYERKKPKPH